MRITKWNCIIAAVFLFVLNLSAGDNAASPQKESFSCSFAEGAWNKSDWMNVSTREENKRHDWIQKKDCIDNGGHYISMLYRKPFKGDFLVSSKMDFAERMAPLIVIGIKTGDAPDGSKLYEELIEVVVWDEGVNVWHIKVVDGKSAAKKTAFWKFRLEKNTAYELSVRRKGKNLLISVGGHSFGYLENSLPEECLVGITACEGVNRFYSFSVEKQ